MAKQFKGNYWNEILTEKGREFLNKNRDEFFGIWCTGNKWNYQDLNNELKVGDVISIPFSPYHYKVFSSGFTKTDDPKVTYQVSKHNENGLLFKWKGIVYVNLLFIYK